ncbi:helix-turn-helix transcriptional regulator [Natribacillus halophilus]|uniref:Regulatory protein, luxR family n=1 Tax=Natribacillus halophilus TaxID=549003 RepID=A0A1G8LM94_9BACI|nr:LuxR C-terminal-related transcriptional regulator [Natribacillus halophilus]SDI56587.1 regulatory protein, luxR family [Natribacillus halophilus]
MIPEYLLQEQLRKVETTLSHEEKLYKILEVYMENFPVLNSFLSRYSPLGYFGEGIISLTSNRFENISYMRDDIRSLPVIFSAIRERKAKYSSGVEFLKQTSSKYISHDLSVVVVPICFDSAVIGFICSTELEKGTTIDEKMLSTLTLYGKLVGQFLESSDSVIDDAQVLSKRELEVMRRISWGENTKEIADRINISEVTVKQYVKSARGKLGAQNRSHAVGELFRKGIIK